MARTKRQATSGTVTADALTPEDEAALASALQAANESSASFDGTPMRQCVGSKTFGIEPHMAPREDFPVQPSRKDGLGVMCKTHWREYTGALRKASLERKAQGIEAPPTATYTDLVEAAERRRAKRGLPPKPAPELVAAKTLVDEVEKLPADEYVARVGDDDVQAALETVGKASTGAGHTPVEEA